jgi:hypothetical protein
MKAPPNGGFVGLFADKPQQVTAVDAMNGGKVRRHAAVHLYIKRFT